MAASGFQRPTVAKLIVAASLTALIACSAAQQAKAQFVNPVTPTTPTLNPSTPNVVAPPAVRPISPGLPNSLSSSPVSPDVSESPPVTARHQDVEHQDADSSSSRRRSASAPSVRHRSVAHHWRLERHYAAGYAAHVTGPSYYPGLGVVYPPYPNPCHWAHVYYGYSIDLGYSCS
jgi:hypothetical protein